MKFIEKSRVFLKIPKNHLPWPLSTSKRRISYQFFIYTRVYLVVCGNSASRTKRNKSEKILFEK